MIDETVARARSKWPDVPAAFGWLALDERGRWRIEGGLVRHRGTIEFINRNYGDQDGQWYFQNGPQRVYVDLDYTPWIYVLDGRQRLHTHTGLRVRTVEAVWVDDRGHLLLLTEYGVGAVSDADLFHLLDRFCRANGDPLDWDATALVLEAIARGEAPALFFRAPAPLAVGSIPADEVPEWFGFEPRPRGESEVSTRNESED